MACTAADANNWTVVDPWTLRPWPTQSRAQPRWKLHDIPPWADARKRLRENEDAIRIASNPDIFVLPNLVDASHAKAIERELYARQEQNDQQQGATASAAAAP